MIDDDLPSRHREIEVRAREVAGYVERYRREKGAWWDELETDLLTRPLHPRPGIRVADAGAGVGRVTAALAGLGCEVDAFDVSLESLRALARSESAMGRRTRAVVCDLALGVPVRVPTYDGVVSGQAIHHIPRRAGRVNAWRGLARASRGNAVLSATVYHHKPGLPTDGVYPGGPAFHRYSVVDLARELNEAGWRPTAYRLCYRFEWKSMPVRAARLLDAILAKARLLDRMATYLHVVAVKDDRGTVASARP